MDDSDIDAKQAQIIELKSQGKTNRDIGKIVYPERSQTVADTLVSRQLKKPHVAKYVDQGKERALAKYNITWDILMAKLIVMLNAEKRHALTGEVMPDNNLQFQVVKELIKMLDKKPEQQLNQVTNNIALIHALKSNASEIDLLDALNTDNKAEDK